MAGVELKRTVDGTIPDVTEARSGKLPAKVGWGKQTTHTQDTHKKIKDIATQSSRTTKMWEPEMSAKHTVDRSAMKNCIRSTRPM